LLAFDRELVLLLRDEFFDAIHFELLGVELGLPVKQLLLLFLKPLLVLCSKNRLLKMLRKLCLDMSVDLRLEIGQLCLDLLTLLLVLGHVLLLEAEHLFELLLLEHKLALLILEEAIRLVHFQGLLLVLLLVLHQLLNLRIENLLIFGFFVLV